MHCPFDSTTTRHLSRAGHVHSFDYTALEATTGDTDQYFSYYSFHSAQSSAQSAGSAPETLLLVFSMQWLTT
jgi:hypothetical protein